MRKPLAFIVFLLTFGIFAGPGWARNIYLNGKLINGVRNTKFLNVTVRVDDKGDVHIVGKQYKVQYKRTTPPTTRTQSDHTTPQARTTPQPRPTLLPRPKRKYVFVGQRSVSQGSGYRVTVFVNGRKVRTILTHLPQDVFDATPYLKKGSNRIEVEAIKMKPQAPGTFTLFLAEGKIGQGQVKVQEPYLLKYKRTGAETKSYRHLYTIDVK